MRRRGWTVKESPFEVDIAIAAACKCDDIVVSSDSDFLAYQSVRIIIRPFRGKFLMYKASGVMERLGVSRDQLMALCIVSVNDYNRNVTSLGSATNLKVIKTPGPPDVNSIVQDYLNHSEVKRKNTCNESFESALKVFVRQEQVVACRDTLDRLEELKQQYKDQKQQQRQQRSVKDLSLTRTSPPEPHNVYSTIDKKHHKRDPPHASGRKYQYRERFSFKTRTRLAKLPAPETMKLHKRKPRKGDSTMEADLPNRINNKMKKKKTKELSGSYQRKDVKCMDKKGLVYTM